MSQFRSSFPRPNVCLDHQKWSTVVTTCNRLQREIYLTYFSNNACHGWDDSLYICIIISPKILNIWRIVLYGFMLYIPFNMFSVFSGRFLA